ncbi:hypothetical protein ZIOFF_060038 [Zingiber officinale]|uniref:Chloroplast lumen common family protein n=1 Tax=Zingiber officinale TaxID=94328 RepID=A0A8J5KND6_ZINOF|nr:hypothetical protein ZIOFF_060038 [Zingiber officinale]
MEPLCCATHRRPLHCPLLPKPLPTPLLLRAFPFSSSSSYSGPRLSILAAASESPRNPLSPLLKAASIAAATATAAAALFLTRLSPPALAAATAAYPTAPAAQSDTLPSEASPLTDAEKERILEEQLDSHPDDTQSLRALMELKIKSGKFAEAVDIVDRLISLEPGEKDLPMLKAHIQSYSGDPETARIGFEQLLEKDPFLVEAYHGLVMVASSQAEEEGELDGILKRVEDVMELCKKAKRKDDLRDFKLLVAQIKVIKGKYEDSLKIYQELVKEEPRDFRPYLCQGIIYTLLRKKDEADKQFQKYKRLVPKSHPYAQYFDENMIAMKDKEREWLEMPNRELQHCCDHGQGVFIVSVAVFTVVILAVSVMNSLFSVYEFTLVMLRSLLKFVLAPVMVLDGGFIWFYDTFVDLQCSWSFRDGLNASMFTWMEG